MPVNVEVHAAPDEYVCQKAEAEAEAPLGGTGVERGEIGGAPLRNAKLVESIVDDSSVDEGADAAEYRDDEMDPLAGARVKAPIGAGEEVHTAEGLEGIDEDVAEKKESEEDERHLKYRLAFELVLVRMSTAGSAVLAWL